MAVVAGYPLGNLTGSPTVQPQSVAVVVAQSAFAGVIPVAAFAVVSVSTLLIESGGGGGGDAVGYPIYS